MPQIPSDSAAADGIAKNPAGRFRSAGFLLSFSMTNKDFIEHWVALFNARKTDELANLYAPDATNHQVANQPIHGRENIRAMFEQEFAAAEMVCIIENIFADGEWAILEWRDPLGLRGCGFFHLVNQQIVFQRGYWDKLSFLRQHGLPVPEK